MSWLRARARACAEDHLDPRVIRHRAAGSGEHDPAVVHGAAQRGQRPMIELGGLVQVEHAVVGQADRPGIRRAGTAAEQRRQRRAVVRRLKRWPAHQSRAGRQQPGHRAHRRDLQRGLLVEVGQQGRQPLREHRRAAAGRPDQPEMMPAGRGHLQRPPGLRHGGRQVGQVPDQRIADAPGRHVSPLRCGRRYAAARPAHELLEGVDGDDLYAGHELRLVRVGRRHDHRGEAGSGDGGHHRVYSVRSHLDRRHMRST